MMLVISPASVQKFDFWKLIIDMITLKIQQSSVYLQQSSGAVEGGCLGEGCVCGSWPHGSTPIIAPATGACGMGIYSKGTSLTMSPVPLCAWRTHSSFETVMEVDEGLS